MNKKPDIRKEFSEIAKLFVEGQLKFASEYQKHYNKQILGIVREAELIANYDLGEVPNVKKMLMTW